MGLVWTFGLRPSRDFRMIFSRLAASATFAILLRVHALPPAPAVRLALVPAFASLRFRMRWFQPSRTQCRGPRRCHSRCPSRFHSPLLTCGPFPPPALPGLSGSTDLSATLTGPACPLRDSGLARAHHRRGFPCCLRPPLTCMLSPVPRRSRPVRASLASRPLTAFPVTSAGRPPHRLFRGLLGVHLITACMLAEPPNGDPFTAECFSPCRCLHEPLRLLPAGTTVRRAGFAPAGGQCLSTAHDVTKSEAGNPGNQETFVAAKEARGLRTPNLDQPLAALATAGPDSRHQHQQTCAMVRRLPGQAARGRSSG